MAFISNKTRSKLVKSVTKYTTGRKIFLVTSIVLSCTYLFVLLISIFVSVFTDELNNIVKQFVLYDINKRGIDALTSLGWVMLVTGCICFLALLVSVIIGFSIPSPHKVKTNIDKLASSAIGGRKIDGSDSTTKVVQERFSKPTKKKN